MEVKVEFSSLLKRFYKDLCDQKNLNIKLKDISTISDLLKIINIPKEYISLITVNKKVAKIDSKLNDGDIIKLFNIIAGG
jgi:sulfur carrier protein ThiS